MEQYRFNETNFNTVERGFTFERETKMVLELVSNEGKVIGTILWIRSTTLRRNEDDQVHTRVTIQAEALGCTVRGLPRTLRNGGRLNPPDGRGIEEYTYRG